MKVESYGDFGKFVKSLMIFIYTAVVSISLVSKTSTPGIELCCSLSLSSLSLLLFWCRICSYFVHYMRKNGACSGVKVSRLLHDSRIDKSRSCLYPNFIAINLVVWTKDEGMGRSFLEPCSKIDVNRVEKIVR